MALVKCHECGAQVSTEAAACPGCGAKPKKSHVGKLLVALVSLVALLVIAGRLIPDTGGRPTTSAEGATASPGASVADRPTGAISTTGLYAEYRADPGAADAKYGGHRTTVSAKIVKTDFADAGVGHVRMMLAVGGGVDTTDAIVLCFTESCASMKRPTVPDDQFKKVKVGDVVVATCTPEPVMSARPQDSRPMVNLSKCSMP